MYDVATKRYVTMDDIAEMAQSGESITIIDNATGKDITQEIVSQLVGRVLDGQARKLPLSVLVGLLRKGSGNMVDFSKKYVSFWQGALNFAEDELDKVDTLISRKKGPDTSDKKKAVPSDDAVYQEEIIEFLDERIDQRIEASIKTRDGDTRKQLSKLRSDIARLTARIETIENLFSRVVKIDKSDLPES